MITGEYDSNYWLCTITFDPKVRVKGQENAYKTIVNRAVGGAAGVIHAASSGSADCWGGENVEACGFYGFGGDLGLGGLEAYAWGAGVLQDN